MARESSSTTDVAAQGQDAAGAGQGGSGLVSAVSGSTAQVQGQTAQVAVSWTDDTTFSKQVSADASDVTVGSCVVVSSDQTADAESSDTLASATVRVAEAVDGTCAPVGGGAGAQGNRPGDGQQGDAADRPTDRPTDAAGGGRGGGGGLATGEVTAVSDTGFTVASQRQGADDEETTVTVTTSADTAYTMTASATATDVKVGVCVTSRGESDDTGALTATNIAVSDPIDGECAVGGGRAGRAADQS